MKLSQNGLNFIKEFEGYHTLLPDGRCQAYWDRTGKVWTIGYGCTEGVTKGMILTPKQASEMFDRELDKHEQYVRDLCKEFKFEPNQNQFDALVSHCYNCGPGGTRKVMKAGFNFRVYGLTSGGKRLPGLTRRRNDEQKLFNKPTVKEIVKESRQLQTMSWISRFLEWSGVSSLLSFATFVQVREYLLDYRTLGILTLGFLMYLTIKYVEFSTVRAALDGRYKPSGRSRKPSKEKVDA